MNESKYLENTDCKFCSDYAVAHIKLSPDSTLSFCERHFKEGNEYAEKALQENRIYQCAVDNIISACKSENNLLNFEIFLYKNYLNDKTMCKINFMLNNKKFTSDIHITSHMFSMYSAGCSDEFYTLLEDKVIKSINNTIGWEIINGMLVEKLFEWNGPIKIIGNESGVKSL
jgi:hypothetical protein